MPEPAKSSRSCAIKSGSLHETKSLQIDDFEIRDLQYDYGVPIYSTFWKGLEDIRFISSSNILVTIPECNKNGQPSIFKATLEDNRVHSFIGCLPNNIEKNWMPYFDETGKPMVIYSLNPFVTKEIESETKDVHENEYPLIYGYHGSTNGIPYKESHLRLFLIHLNQEISIHRWLQYNLKTSTIKVSEPFVFFKHSYIEFPVSLAKFNDRIFVSIGVNDDRAFILELDGSDIENSLNSFGKN